MSLLESEAGKRRLLSVEIPVIERYNEGRDPAFRIRLRQGRPARWCCATVSSRATTSTRWKRAWSPAIRPCRRKRAVLTPLKHCPHLLEGQTLCLWRQGSTRATSRWDPAVHLYLRRPGRLALAGLLRSLARNRRMAVAGSEMRKQSEATDSRRILCRRSPWLICSRSARAAAGCRCWICSCRDPRITHVTLIEPDVYKPHNVERHLFPLSAVGKFKADLAEHGCKDAGPTCEVRTLLCDLLRPGRSRRPSTKRRPGRHRRLCRGQRAGQVSLGRPDAPPRQAVDAGRGAQRRHRRLRALVRAGRTLLRLRRQPFAARR